jgi:type IV secretion system protein VirB9
MTSFFKPALIVATMTLALTGAGFFGRAEIRGASGATVVDETGYATSVLSAPVSDDIYGGVEGFTESENDPLSRAQPLELPGVPSDSGSGVVEIDDPDSLIFDQKLSAIEKVPPMRPIDGLAVKLASAYDEANGAPKPYMQENGRINFYFGTMNPRIICKPLRLTDIELEPGEQVRNVHISDSVRWSVSGASSGGDKNLVTHVILKPQLPDIAANLLVHTDRRTYSIELVSIAEGQFMPFVGFVYPETPKSTKAADAESWQGLLAQYKRADDIRSAQTKKVEPNARTINPENVYADYTIKIIQGKNIPWKPDSVYDSNGKTYISMPDKMQVTEAPIMYIKQNGREKLVNYRVEGDLYIIDRLFDIGILAVGKDRVAIYRNVPVAAPDTVPGISN